MPEKRFEYENEDALFADVEAKRIAAYVQEGLSHVEVRSEAERAAVLSVIQTIKSLLGSAQATSERQRAKYEAYVNYDLPRITNDVHRELERAYFRLSGLYGTNGSGLVASDRELYTLLDQVFSDVPTGVLSRVRARLSGESRPDLDEMAYIGKSTDRLTNDETLRQQVAERVFSPEGIAFFTRQYYLLGGRQEGIGGPEETEPRILVSVDDIDQGELFKKRDEKDTKENRGISQWFKRREKKTFAEQLRQDDVDRVIHNANIVIERFLTDRADVDTNSAAFKKFKVGIEAKTRRIPELLSSASKYEWQQLLEDILSFVHTEAYRHRVLFAVEGEGKRARVPVDSKLITKTDKQNMLRGLVFLLRDEQKKLETELADYKIWASGVGLSAVAASAVASIPFVLEYGLLSPFVPGFLAIPVGLSLLGYLQRSSELKSKIRDIVFADAILWELYMDFL